MRTTIQFKIVPVILLSCLLARPANASTNSIAPGQTRSGSISGSAIDVYKYTSGGNEWITIATARTDVGSGTVQQRIHLMSTHESVLKTNQSFLQSFRLTNAGVYQIVSHETGAVATGPYALTPTLIPYTTLFRSASTNSIAPGQTRSGSISGSAIDVYKYTSGGNEWITIATARTDVGSG